MCGICGAVNISQAEKIITRMNQALIHRGPDSDGFFIGSNYAFGMRRLSIIDLDSGDQPIYNEDDSVAIFLNG